MSEAASTSVDVLIARLESHPDEFFKREAVASYDGEKIFAHTKWRRITTTLLVNKAPDEQNLWIDLFSQDERQRFRDAIFKAIRAELDTQIMRVLVGEDPLVFNPDAQEEAARAARGATQLKMMQQAAQGALNGPYGGYGQAFSGGAIGGSASSWSQLKDSLQAEYEDKCKSQSQSQSQSQSRSMMDRIKGRF